MAIKFGPSGHDVLYIEQGNKSTFGMAKWLSNLGLNAYEYSFGRGIKLSEETAINLSKEFKEYGISVSVHAPYFINFANPSYEMAEKSYNYVINSCKICKLLGGNRVVVHTGSCGKLERETAIKLCEERLKILKQKLIENGCDDCLICFETMGKYSQIGTYKEIVKLCKISNNYIPTFDFGHINCIMQGSLKTECDFTEILQYAINELGFDKVKNIHIHFSKIQFSEKGEIKHLTLDDEIYGPEFINLAKSIKKLCLEPVIICESDSIMAQDAVKMKKIYDNLVD